MKTLVITNDYSPKKVVFLHILNLLLKFRF